MCITKQAAVFLPSGRSRQNRTQVEFEVYLHYLNFYNKKYVYITYRVKTEMF